MNYSLLTIVIFVAGTISAAPVLKISPSNSFNFGKFPANQEQRHTFLLTNVGDGSLDIDKIRVTCGCSAANVDKKQLKPGETARLTAQINRESIVGPFSKGIFIHSNASNGRIQVVTLNGEAVPLVTVLPQKQVVSHRQQICRFVLSTYIHGFFCPIRNCTSVHPPKSANSFQKG